MYENNRFWFNWKLIEACLMHAIDRNGRLKVLWLRLFKIGRWWIDRSKRLGNRLGFCRQVLVAKALEYVQVRSTLRELKHVRIALLIFNQCHNLVLGDLGTLEPKGLELELVHS